MHLLWRTVLKSLNGGTAMKMLLIAMLLTSGCHVEQQSSEDKSLLKAGSKTIKELSDTMLPTIKRVVKSGATSGDYDELIALIKAGKIEGKAAARAFKMLVQKPIVEVDTLVVRLKAAHKSNPLAAKGNKIMLADLNKKLDELSEAVEEHNKALAALNKLGINTRALRVKIEMQQSLRWKKALKDNYLNQFSKVSSLEIQVSRTTAVLSGAAAVSLPLSLKELMSSDEY